jgi:hypothetical protein
MRCFSNCTNPNHYTPRVHHTEHHKPRYHNSPNLQRLPTFQAPDLISFFNCLGRAKESVQIRGALKYFVTHYFFMVRVFSPTPNPKAGVPPLVGCQRLFIRYIRSYTPHLEAFSSVRNLRTRHAVVTRDPPSLPDSLQIRHTSLSVKQSPPSDTSSS